MRTFRNGDWVTLSHAKQIPQRYRGRTAEVVGKEKFRDSVRYLVSFGSRRVEPLPVAARFLTAL